jgi:hypothetical protein
LSKQGFRLGGWLYDAKACQQCASLAQAGGGLHATQA